MFCGVIVMRHTVSVVVWQSANSPGNIEPFNHESDDIVT